MTDVLYNMLLSVTAEYAGHVFGKAKNSSSVSLITC